MRAAAASRLPSHSNLPAPPWLLIDWGAARGLLSAQPCRSQVTEEDLDAFHQQFRGGEEERAELLKHYQQFKGDMGKVGRGCGEGGGLGRREQGCPSAGRALLAGRVRAERCCAPGECRQGGTSWCVLPVSHHSHAQPWLSLF